MITPSQTGKRGRSGSQARKASDSSGCKAMAQESVAGHGARTQATQAKAGCMKDEAVAVVQTRDGLEAVLQMQAQCSDTANDGSTATGTRNQRKGEPAGCQVKR